MRWNVSAGSGTSVTLTTDDVAVRNMSELIDTVTFTSSLMTATSPSAIVLSVAVSAGIGIVFGFYPAWRASRPNPIDALRYE